MLQVVRATVLFTVSRVSRSTTDTTPVILLSRSIDVVTANRLYKWQTLMRSRSNYKVVDWTHMTFPKQAAIVCSVVTQCTLSCLSWTTAEFNVRYWYTSQLTHIFFRNCEKIAMNVCHVCFHKTIYRCSLEQDQCPLSGRCDFDTGIDDNRWFQGKDNRWFQGKV